MGIGWSIHKNNGWRDQLDRVRRWHSRVIEAAKHGHGDLEDFIYAFFQNCNQLREWIEKTGTVEQKDIETLFAQTPELRVCRDICNGTKHLTLTRPSVDAGLSICREYDPGTPSGHRLSIIAHGDRDWVANNKYDLVKLASRCLEAWEQFTVQHVT